MANTRQPISSPIQFYNLIGTHRAATRRMMRKAPAREHVVRQRESMLIHSRSRDLPSHTPLRRTPLHLAALLLLLLALSACTAAASPDRHPIVSLLGNVPAVPTRYLFDFPARTTFTMLFTAGLLVGFVPGVMCGIWLAITLLRAADSAANHYHLRMVAMVLDASSSVHSLVNEIVATATDRIAALRRELRRIKEAQS